MTRQEAIKWLFNLKMDIGKMQHQELWHYEQAIDEIIQALEQEPKRGKWKDIETETNINFGQHYFVCSECTRSASYFIRGSENWWHMKKPNYCPNCGARMERDIK